jgi:subtilase family protein
LLAKIRNVEPVAAQRVADQKAEGVDGGHGIYLQFESAPGFDLKFESLDFAPSGIELCAVRSLPNNLTQATVFVPDGKLAFFLKRITAYRDEDTKPNEDGETRPKNEDLVASISNIRIAALEALWTDQSELFPGADQDATWEVWLRRTGKIDHLARLREHAAKFNLTVGEQVIAFIDRTIVLVHGKGRDLARSIDILGVIAELRLAKTTADFFTGMTAVEQQAWVDDLVKRTEPAADGAPYLCLFDTGLNRGHPLIGPAAAEGDLHSYKPQWGVDDRYRHGTPMAGLAVYGDLAMALGGGQKIKLSHRLESVKIINEADPHDKELYGAVTQESAYRVEVTPDRRRVYCMAVTATDARDRGRPSSWSAAIDELTSGRTDGNSRLMIIAGGNTVPAEWRNYPASNLTDGVHDPAQSWNALTVGGYTEKAIIDQKKYPGWEALATAGDLAPASCTSMTWKNTKWPIKPDIVLEAGNMARHPDHADPDYIDDALQLLSTPHDFAGNKPLVTFGDTSAATALAARLASMLWAKYPRLTLEAVRALLIHSAAWTPAMLKRFTNGKGPVDYDGLVRCFGYGTPNVRQLLSSADNALTLVAQGSIQPFHKDGDSIKARELKLHALPWPTETLTELQETPVTLRVTLSYFIEPNPGDRGWSTKYGYQSHGNCCGPGGEGPHRGLSNLWMVEQEAQSEGL